MGRTDAERRPVILIKKKICLFGAFGVGKTSLIARFVYNTFSPKYFSTVGVKIDKKTISLGPGREVVMMVWDFAGRDDYISVSDSYLRGMSGYFLVADGTRPETLAGIDGIESSLGGLFSSVPSVLLLNKADLASEWRLPNEARERFEGRGFEVIRTSAKDGRNVEESFRSLGMKMLAGEP